MTRSPRQRLGAAGEARAAEWYESRGYRVLDRNWRHGRGELDLVLLHPAAGTVVFAEVKTRSSAAFGTGLEGVTVAKMAQLRRLAAAWLREHRHRVAVRFDVVSITGGELEVISDAF